MERLHNGFTLALSEGAFPLSTDAVVLSDFVRLPKNAAVLDLGAGCGTLGLLLCARDSLCAVTGVELDAAAHAMALENARRNGLQSRLGSICADWRHIPTIISPGSYSCCLSNPPYHTGGRNHRSLSAARQEAPGGLDSLFDAAAWALKPGGDFYLVHRPERLVQLCVQAQRVGLEPKRLRLVRHHCAAPVGLVLLQCRKGGRPGLKWEELCLFDPQGQPTADYRRIYHL